MKVFQAINAVQSDLLSGIKKTEKNAQQGFVFRGIDNVYNALAPALAKHGLVILPEVLEREVTERKTRNGGALFYVVLKVNYHFASAEDGSKFTVCAYGEAMDSGDKATNKAMSAAYKYACFQAFCIPTENVDADAETHEIIGETTGEKLDANKIKKAHDYFKSEIDADNDDFDYAKIQSAWARLSNDEGIAVMNMFGKEKCGTRQYKNVLNDCLKQPLDDQGQPIFEDLSDE